MSESKHYRITNLRSQPVELYLSDDDVLVLSSYQQIDLPEIDPFTPQLSALLQRQLINIQSVTEPEPDSPEEDPEE